MEVLNRNNYEIWFLDYLDGQLSDEQLNTLLDFLEQNPDLKNELHGISEVNLKAEQEFIAGKDLLMKSPDDIPGISSIDRLCIARMENDLPDEQAKQFDARLTEDAGLEKNFAAFKLTRLNPADQVTYPYKNDLIKNPRKLSPWIITAVSAAAILVLALLLWPVGDQSAVGNRQSAVGNRQLAIGSRQSAVGSQQLAESSKPANAIVIPTKVGTPSLTTTSRKAGFQDASMNREPFSVIPAKAGTSSHTAADKAGTSSREATPMNSLSRRTSIAGPKIPDPLSTRILYASNYQPVMKSQAGSEKILTLPQYALQLFRERILGEDRQLVKKTQFSMWEVAGAGVNRINSLAGTKMKLNRKYDSKGDLLAVSFNSKLIDVNTPVRVQENR